MSPPPGLSPPSPLFSSPCFATMSSPPHPHPPPPCITNCANLLKHSLGSIIGGYKVSRADLLAPLHSIIRSSANNVVVRRKTEWICLSIDKFKLCSDDCDDNKQKMVELANVGHWHTICRVLFSSPKVFSDFISCQRRHLEEVTRRCHSLPQEKEEHSLGQFCRNMRDYTKCYSETRLKCSRNATQTFRQITDSIGQSFGRIRQLSRGHLNIPEDCHAPIVESVRAIVEKESSREASSEGDADYWNDKGEEDDGRRSGQQTGIGRSSGTIEWCQSPLLLLPPLSIQMLLTSNSFIRYIYN